MVIVEGTPGHITITGINVTADILPTMDISATIGIHTIMGTNVTINILTTDTASTGGILVFGSPTAFENTTTRGDIGDNLKGTSALVCTLATSGLDMALKITIAALLATLDTEGEWHCQ